MFIIRGAVQFPGNRKQVTITLIKADLCNEGSTISGFHKTGRAARCIPHPLEWGGRTQFDLEIIRDPLTDSMPLAYDIVHVPEVVME